MMVSKFALRRNSTIQLYAVARGHAVSIVQQLIFMSPTLRLTRCGSAAFPITLPILHSAARSAKLCTRTDAQISLNSGHLRHRARKEILLVSLLGSSGIRYAATGAVLFGT